MAIVNPYEWRVLSERPGKRILGRVDPSTMEVEICEEWLEDPYLHQARVMRDAGRESKDLMPLAVIPPSVEARAIKEGWINDDKQWKRWINDIDNRKLKVTDGRA